MRFSCLFLCSAILSSTTALQAGPARLLKDVNQRVLPGSPSRTDGSWIQFATALGRGVVFLADDGIHGFEPWVTDGTAEGTRLIADLRAGPFGSTVQPGQLVEWNGRAWFQAYDEVHGYELWSTDGTEAGTRILRDFPTEIFLAPRILTELDDLLLLSVDDGVNGAKLWATDGTDAGTRLVKDIRPTNVAVRLGDAAYFLAIDSSGIALYRSDGTTAGTVRVTGEGWQPMSYPAVFQGAIWIGEYDEATNLGQLWKSDGTTEGTVQVSDGPGFLADTFVPAGDRLYFMGYYGSGDDAEPWTSDGTAAGTHRVKDIWPGRTGSFPYGFTATKGGAVFVAQEVVFFSLLWRTDGTEEGTVPLGTVLLDSTESSILGALDDIVLFRGVDAESGSELWRTDGTTAGTQRVQDLFPGCSSSSPSLLVTFGSRTFIVGNDEFAGREPWVARTGILARSPERCFADLADDVRALGLPPGVQQSLLAKLSAAETAAGRPRGLRQALKLLDVFSRDVESRSPSLIPEAAASDLIDFTAEIQELLSELSVPVADVPRSTIGDPGVSLDRPAR